MPGRRRFLLVATNRAGFYCQQLSAAVLGVLLSVSVTWAQGKIYSWTDKNGVVHFSDSVTSPQDFSKSTTLSVSTRQGGKSDKSGSDEIPLVTFSDRPSQKFVRAQLTGDQGSREVLMLVDTGAQLSLVDQQLAQELKLEHLEEATLRGVNGVTKSWIGRLPTLRLGDEEVKDVRVLVGSQPGLVLLGMDVIDRLKLSVGPQSLHRR